MAAVAQAAPGWIGAGSWIVVGLAAIPGSAMWTALAHRWSRPTLLAAALMVQAAGIALAGLIPGQATALVAAAAFGGTFVGISCCWAAWSWRPRPWPPRRSGSGSLTGSAP